MPVSLQTRLIVQNPRKCGLGSIRLAGTIAKNPGVPRANMRVLGSYAVVYVVAGGGTYADARGRELPVSPGDLITVFPELAHAYGPQRGQAWDEMYIVFDGPVFDLWRSQKLLDDERPVRRFEPIEYWLRRWQEVVESPGEAGADDTLAAVCRLQQTLADALLYESAQTTTDQDRRWLTRACELLEQSRESEERLVPAVAERLDMSYANFRKKFTRLMGLPPGRYRMKKLMDRACELIYQQRLTNKQVALECGFCDEFHFSRRFKQIVGISPKEFRRQLP
jgi:AraC-like DNA-binding protein